VKTQSQLELTAGGGVETFYDAKVLGAPFKVYLKNGYQVKADSKTGKKITEILDLPGLIGEVVIARILHERKLGSEDFKFIRSALAMRSSELAEHIGVTPEHYSRCENGVKTMSVAQEKLYRLLVYLLMSVRDKEVSDKIKELKKKGPCPGEDRKAIKVISKLFLDLKVSPVHVADEELCFSFTRAACEKGASEEGDWNNLDNLAA
jgi:DNA-binding XRE family transcriptional regulator